MAPQKAFKWRPKDRTRRIDEKQAQRGILRKGVVSKQKMKGR